MRPRPEVPRRANRLGGYAPHPSPHLPDSSWCRMKRRNNTGFSRIPSRLAHRARPIRQYWTDATLSRLLPPSPAIPGSGYLQLRPTATTMRRRRSFTPVRNTRASWRTINFCRFLTVARFPSCAAVKIRCRSRRTLSSWCRQSTASQERAASSGPFTIGCLTCPSVPALRVRFASQAHLSTSAPLSRPGHQARYPASYPATTAWRSHSRLLVSCRLSPAGIRFLDILFPPENSALLTVGLPTRHQGGPDSVGVPMFRTHEMRPGWVPPLPRGGGVLPTSAASPIGACRFSTASPIPR